MRVTSSVSDVCVFWLLLGQKFGFDCQPTESEQKLACYKFSIQYERSAKIDFRDQLCALCFF